MNMDHKVQHHALEGADNTSNKTRQGCSGKKGEKKKKRASIEGMNGLTGIDQFEFKISFWNQTVCNLYRLTLGHCKTTGRKSKHLVDNLCCVVEPLSMYARTPVTVCKQR